MLVHTFLWSFSLVPLFFTENVINKFNILTTMIGRGTRYSTVGEKAFGIQMFRCFFLLAFVPPLRSMSFATIQFQIVDERVFYAENGCVFHGRVQGNHYGSNGGFFSLSFNSNLVKYHHLFGKGFFMLVLNVRVVCTATFWALIIIAVCRFFLHSFIRAYS